MASQNPGETPPGVGRRTRTSPSRLRHATLLTDLGGAASLRRDAAPAPLDRGDPFLNDVLARWKSVDRDRLLRATEIDLWSGLRDRLDG
ncbi:MAG: hypothetical protein R3F20_14860 [Planctomycetota bacterium]